LGCAIWGERAAIPSAKVVRAQWGGDTRLEAARILAELHKVKFGDLSDELATLIARSYPNRGRVFRGVAGDVWPVQGLEDEMPDWRSRHPELAREVQKLLSAGEPTARRQTLVHGDYFSANLLLGPEGLRAIDWEMAALGDPCGIWPSWSEPTGI
jgi:aminoglycoside phosphotransferase (APT) family kinase protein